MIKTITNSYFKKLITKLRQSESLSRLLKSIQSSRTKLFYKYTYLCNTCVPRKSPVRMLTKLKQVGDPLNILFLGTDKQQDYGGMIQALAKFGRLTELTRLDGTYGLLPSSSITSLNAYEANTLRIKQICKDLAQKDRAPDIIIGQMWGCSFNMSLLSDLRDMYGTLSISISMDDRHTFWGGWLNNHKLGSSGVSPFVNLALTAAPECVSWFNNQGCPAMFFPEASDPLIFFPMPDLPKIHDVSFVGACYGIRKKIVDGLRAVGIQITTYGNGWDTGRLDIAEVPKLFAQSKIILGVGTIGHCDDFYALKLRDFDAPMSGSFYITNANPDLDLLFKVGEEIETYTDISDCVKKIQYYLAHDEHRESIARQGLARVLQDHTWELRFKTVFDMLRSN